MVTIRGLNLRLYKHQFIASMWMKEHETGDCEGGWNAEEIGFGKVCTFSHFSLSHVLSSLG